MTDNWRDGNQIELLINGEEFFPSLFDCIRHATQEVILETFIFYEDSVGNELQKTLIEAAGRGVHVEITVDDYGTSELRPEFIKEMTDAGVKYHIFDPQSRFLGVRVNLFRRLHRKIAVIDAKIAFVGGINFSEDHLVTKGDAKKVKQDYAVKVCGPIVQDIHNVCNLLLEGAESAKKNLKKKPSSLPPKVERVGTARVLLAVRDNIKHTKDIERHYLRAIHGAKKHLTIANAYFFPGYRLLWAIGRAARRGVKVNLILQGQPDMPWVSACTRLLYRYFLRKGVVIHEYCQRPLHGKVALVDDKWATVGSSNLDPLSLSLNLEANLVIEDGPFNRKLSEHLQSLLQSHCKPVDMELARAGYWWRMPLVFIAFHFLRYFPVVAGWFPAHSPKLMPPKINEQMLQDKNNFDVEKIT